MFLNVCKETFHVSHVHASQKVKDILMWNVQHIIFMWRRRYWQIFKSALVYVIFLQEIKQIRRSYRAHEKGKPFLVILFFCLENFSILFHIIVIIIIDCSIPVTWIFVSVMMSGAIFFTLNFFVIITTDNIAFLLTPSKTRKRT